MSDLWRAQFDQVVEALGCMGFLVWQTTDEEDRVCFSDRYVYINSRNHPETKFYTLLHELGHVLISMNWAQFKLDHPMYVHSPDTPIDGRRQRAKSYRVSLVSEEIEAWKLGRRFAKSLNMCINDKKYDKHMTEAVMSYIEWAAGNSEE
tara:strand:+ start:140 stop:586 length:447 start_codon:yes stop_codon:yes gene_type:complete